MKEIKRAQITNIRNEGDNIITDFTDIKEIKEDYIQFYVNKFDN